ncbi:MAG: VWA domain-containing protein [Bacteroidales bacterium]|nr:VWA domain-containing protein [Bacteroidales bacterium]
MKTKFLIFITTLLFAVTFAATAEAQTKTSADGDKTHVLIILDCSNSMWDRWQSDSKIKVTQQVLLKFLDSIANQHNIEVALRVFGHLNRNSYGTRLEVPFEKDNNYKIQSKIKTLVPNGACTAASALSSSLNDFPTTVGEPGRMKSGTDNQSRNIILIITDGMDDCDGNICDVARQVQMSGVIVQTFILGIGNKKDFQHSLDCAGKFTYVPDEVLYSETLYNIFRMSEEEAQVVVSLNDETDHLLEAEIPIAFYDSQTGVVKYSTLYSIDGRYTPDTLIVDPLVTYDITLFTKPETHLKRKQFRPGRVNRLNITVEQGSLQLRLDGKRVNYQIPQYQILVYRHGTTELVASQLLGEQKDYLSGSYDLELLSTPPLRLEGISVVGSSATDLSIPTPGLANINKSKVISSGAIFAYKEGVLTYVCDLNPNKVNERLLLMPGEYQLVIKPQNSILYSTVRSMRFQIESGQTTNINLGSN